MVSNMTPPVKFNAAARPASFSGWLVARRGPPVDPERTRQRLTVLISQAASEIGLDATRSSGTEGATAGPVDHCDTRLEGCGSAAGRCKPASWASSMPSSTSSARTAGPVNLLRQRRTSGSGP